MAPPKATVRGAEGAFAPAMAEERAAISKGSWGGSVRVAFGITVLLKRSLLGFSIGAAFGGVLEYSSLALGYNALTLIVALCDTFVFILLRIHMNAKANIQGELHPAGAPQPSVSA
jgi:hypothetical protein